MRTVPTRIDFIKDFSPGSTGVEVGVQRGAFSEEMLATGVLKRLTLIDPWAHSEDPEYALDPANVAQNHQDTLAAYVAMKFHDDPRVDILRMTSQDAAFHFWAMPHHPRFSFVFLDGRHDFSSVGLDLVLWSQFTDTILCHDYVDNEASRALGFGVKAAVDKFVEVVPGWKITAVSKEEWTTCRLNRV